MFILLMKDACFVAPPRGLPGAARGPLWGSDGVMPACTPAEATVG